MPFPSYEDLVEEFKDKGIDIVVPDENDPLDLTQDDTLAVNTEKAAEGDEFLPTPSQSPDFIPPTTVDDRGDPV